MPSQREFDQPGLEFQETGIDRKSGSRVSIENESKIEKKSAFRRPKMESELDNLGQVFEKSSPDGEVQSRKREFGKKI